MANVSDRNSTDINVNVNDFVKIVDDVATPLFRKDNKQPVDNKYTHFTKHDWYNNNCKEKNRVFNHALMISERIVHMKIDINSLMLVVNINLLCLM